MEKHLGMSPKPSLARSDPERNLSSYLWLLVGRSDKRTNRARDLSVFDEQAMKIKVLPSMKENRLEYRKFSAVIDFVFKGKRYTHERKWHDIGRHLIPCQLRIVYAMASDLANCTT